MNKDEYYFAPGRGAKYFDQHVCISVCLSLCFVCLFICLSLCLSARTSQKLHVRISPNSLYVLPVAVARSSSDGNATCYVLPVLRMTRCLSHNGANGPESKMTRMFRPVRQVAAPRAKSAVSDCILLFCTAVACSVMPRTGVNADGFDDRINLFVAHIESVRSKDRHHASTEPCPLHFIAVVSSMLRIPDMLAPAAAVTLATD